MIGKAINFNLIWFLFVFAVFFIWLINCLNTTGSILTTKLHTLFYDNLMKKRLQVLPSSCVKI